MLLLIYNIVAWGPCLAFLAHENWQNLSKTTTICTNINETLTKELLTAKSIYFDKYEALIKKESKYIYLTNKETRKEKKSEKPELAKNDLINIIGTITNYCHYPKIHKLEAIISNFLKP